MSALNVKPGDVLAISERYGSGYERCVTVERVSSTQATCKCGTRFMLSSRKVVGGNSGWTAQYVTLITPEIERQMREKALRKWASSQASGEIGALSVDRIERVQDFVRVLTAEQKGGKA